MKIITWAILFTAYPADNCLLHASKDDYGAAFGTCTESNHETGVGLLPMIACNNIIHAAEEHQP